MLSVSSNPSSTAIVSQPVKQDTKPKADKLSVSAAKQAPPIAKEPDVLTLSVPETVVASAKVPEASSANNAAKAAEKLVAELEKTKELVTKLDPPKSGSPKPTDPAPTPLSQPPSDSTDITPPTTDPTQPADPPIADGSGSSDLTATIGGSTTFVFVKVREAGGGVTAKDLTGKFDTLQAQFKELSDKVDDLNAVSERLDKLTKRFEKLIKVMFQGAEKGNLNLANLNAALAVARLSQNALLGFGGTGQNGGSLFNSSFNNLSGIGGFVQTQNLLLQNKGLSGALQSVSKLKKAFEAQLATVTEQLKEVGSSLDTQA